MWCDASFYRSALCADGSRKTRHNIYLRALVFPGASGTASLFTSLCGRSSGTSNICHLTLFYQSLYPKISQPSSHSLGFHTSLCRSINNCLSQIKKGCTVINDTTFEHLPANGNYRYGVDSKACESSDRPFLIHLFHSAMIF